MPVVTWLQPGEGTATPVRFSTRLRAWWEGYDLSVLKRMIESGEIVAAEVPSVHADVELGVDGEPLDKNGKPLWNATRIDVAEKLWGQDFLTPGGAEHAAYLVKPFGITSSMSILDLSAGLGGAARTIAREYKAWVTGLEPSALVASMGGARSTKEKMNKQAPVMHYDPANLKLDKKYDGIFSKEAFFTFDDKEKLLDEVVSHIKADGQFLFTDYCVENGDTDIARLSGWIDAEPVKPALWSVGHYVKALKARKLEVRVMEDITPLQRQLIFTGLGMLLQQLDAHKLSVQTKLAVLDEVELWARRMAAFDQGLKVYRFFCIKR